MRQASQGVSDARIVQLQTAVPGHGFSKIRKESSNGDKTGGQFRHSTKRVSNLHPCWSHSLVTASVGCVDPHLSPRISSRRYEQSAELVDRNRVLSIPCF